MDCDCFVIDTTTPIREQMKRMSLVGTGSKERRQVMYNAKRTRKGSKLNADNQKPTIDPSHYLYKAFPIESPVQPNDEVEYEDDAGRKFVGVVLSEGAYLSNDVIFVRVDFGQYIDAVAAELLTPVFDYARLDSETRIVVQQKTGEIKTLMRRAAQDIIDIGTKLIEVKGKLGHGNFGKWLNAEFNWSESSALRMMRVANSFKNVTVTDLKIGAKALYLLSAPSTPEEAREEALEIARSGQPVTFGAAKAIVAQHKEPAALPAGEPPRQPAPLPPVEAYKQAERVFAPVTRPPAISYGRVEDDYVDDVPSVAVDDTPNPDPSPVATGEGGEPEPDWQSELENDVDATLSESVVVDEPEEKPATNFAHLLSGSNEWYTPMVYTDAARQLMVGITLDPASCEMANQIVRAAMYYDINSNGLDKPWEGSVFLNPPYGWDENGDSNVAVWTTKLLTEYKAGRVTEAVLLVNATTERKWFQPLWQFPICFTDHRINFYNANGEQKQPTQGNAFIYLGENVHSFAHIFGQFGAIVKRMQS